MLSICKGTSPGPCSHLCGQSWRVISISFIHWNRGLVRQQQLRWAWSQGSCIPSFGGVAVHMFLYLLRCRSKQIGLVNNELILSLEQLKTVQREMNTSQWHSPLCYYLNSLAVLHICEGWSWCSSYCLFISEEQEVAPFTDSPSSFWGTGHPFNESFHNRAYTSYIRQTKRATWKKIGGKDKVTVKLS